MSIYPKKKVSYISFLRTLVILAFIILHKFSFAQDPYAKVSVQRGHSISFHFNTYSDYTNGKELNEWSRVILNFNNSDPGVSGWQLVVKADTPDNFLYSEGDEKIPLSALTIDLNIISSNDIGITHLPSFSPTTADLIIMSGTKKDNMEVEFTLTYNLGKLGETFNKKPGSFFVGLSFDLMPN